MPLSRQRNAERMRQARLHVQPNSMVGHVVNSPLSVKEESATVQPECNLKVPLYNPSIHRAGDLVIVQKGKRFIEMVIPEIDADGNAVYI